MSTEQAERGFTPPAVAPPASTEGRPLWSVMIPTFNCAGYLRRTLESVLSQDPGAAAMQIEVVDDCSTNDDPEAVVKEVGGGRVMFHRKPANGGAIRNFNTCIDRSRGDLVHILHGDDLVMPGFYRRLGAAAEAHPDCALIACRALYINEEGVIWGVADRVPSLEAGGRDVREFLYRVPILTPGVVVRRRFYERHGGFLPALVHTADWEMWCRAIGEAGGVVLPDVLAQYREFAANDTSKLKRRADNLRDIERLFGLFAARHPEFDRKPAAARLMRDSAYQAALFRRLGDHEAHRANLEYYRSRVPLVRRVSATLKACLRRVADWLP
jgi:glycosyltransferase involved in cell wall biosynthesis